MTEMLTDSARFADLVEETRVRGEIYRDPRVFDAEMQRIFGRVWVYVAHESEIAEPGDYKTTTLGTRPIIVVRDTKGTISVLFNRCRHRGATVCQEARGNARHFRCAYHGWTYACDGRLTGVPHPGGYGPAFDKRSFGLLAAPRVESHRGFIWASLAEEGPSLGEYLGGAAELIDEFCDVSPTGNIRLEGGRHRPGYNGNWKLQAENAVDGYHPGVVHQSFQEAMRKSIDPSRVKQGIGALYTDKSPCTVRDLGNGHLVLDQRVIAPLGPDERSGGGFIVLVFPNLMLIGAQVRTIIPIAHDRTEVSVDFVVYSGLEDLTEQRLRTHEFFFGPAGFGQPDDGEMFERITAGLGARLNSEDDWVTFSRGVDRQWSENGDTVSNITDEVGQRALYRTWKSLMAATP